MIGTHGAELIREDNRTLQQGRKVLANLPMETDVSAPGFGTKRKFAAIAVKHSDGFINDKKMVKENVCFSSNLILDTMEDDSMIESHEFDDANPLVDTYNFVNPFFESLSKVLCRI